MNIVIAGAGYAGTVAANLLARKGRGLTVTVVSPHSEFVERVRLHQEIAGSGPATRPLSEMLDSRVVHRKAAVEKVGDGVVELSDGTSLDFDRMIYAVGSSAAAPEGTVAVGDVDQAREAARRLRVLQQGATVTVVGAGLTGIEAASEIAEQRPTWWFGSSVTNSARRSEMLRGAESPRCCRRWASRWSAARGRLSTTRTSHCGQWPRRPGTWPRAAVSTPMRRAGCESIRSFAVPVTRTCTRSVTPPRWREHAPAVRPRCRRARTRRRTCSPNSEATS